MAPPSTVPEESAGEGDFPWSSRPPVWICIISRLAMAIKRDDIRSERTPDADEIRNCPTLMRG